MVPIKTGIAGTMESSDIMITLEPSQGEGVSIELDSTVEKQFGREIRQVMQDTLASMGISSAKIHAVDKGALDCVIRARLKAAIYRACDDENYQWGGAAK